jgi:hypothetical protein
VENVEARVGPILNCEPSDVAIRDVAVHPLSHSVYMSVQRGRGHAALPVPVPISHAP